MTEVDVEKYIVKIKRSIDRQYGFIEVYKPSNKYKPIFQYPLSTGAINFSDFNQAMHNMESILEYYGVKDITIQPSDNIREVAELTFRHSDNKQVIVKIEVAESDDNFVLMFREIKTY